MDPCSLACCPAGRAVAAMPRHTISEGICSMHPPRPVSPSRLIPTRRNRLVLTAALVALLLVPTLLRGVATATSLTIFGDALASGWTNCSWDAGVDFASTSSTYNGSRAIQVTVNPPHGGLCLQSGQAVDGAS